MWHYTIKTNSYLSHSRLCCTLLERPSQTAAWQLECSHPCRKKYELIKGAKKYHHALVGISSTKRRISGLQIWMGGYYFVADPKMSAQAGGRILTSPQLPDYHFNFVWDHRFVHAKIQRKEPAIKPIACVRLQCCERISGLCGRCNNALQRVGSTESAILLRDFNAHIGTNNEALKGVIGRHVDPAFKENG